MGAIAEQDEEKCRDTRDRRGRAISTRWLNERRKMEEDSLTKGRKAFISLYKKWLIAYDYAISGGNVRRAFGCQREAYTVCRFHINNQPDCQYICRLLSWIVSNYYSKLICYEERRQTVRVHAGSENREGLMLHGAATVKLLLLSTSTSDKSCATSDLR
jgi:hypothetical protein